jgi:hypothetical protein
VTHSAGLILEIEVGERMAVGVADNVLRRDSCPGHRPTRAAGSGLEARMALCSGSDGAHYLPICDDIREQPV